MNGYNVQTLKIIADEGGLEDVYARGYNDAKREIALSGEYERVYNRGKEAALTALESLENEYKAYHTSLYPTGKDSDYWRGVRYALDVLEGIEGVKE